MKVVLLGTGGPRPDPRRNATTTLIRHGDENILFDAGRGVAVQLVKAGVPLAAVNPVFITHHHFDHIGDLYDLMLATWMGGRKDALQIYGPPETERIVNALVTQVYDKDIYWRATGEPALGGWKPVVARRRHRRADHRCRALAHPCRDGQPRRRSRHPAAFSRALDLPRLSLRGRRQGDRDQRRHHCLRGPRPPGVGRRCARSVLLPGVGRDRQRAFSPAVAVHARLRRQRGKIAAKAGVRTLVLTHHRVRADDDMLERVAEEVARDFKGRLIIGSDLLEIEV